MAAAEIDQYLAGLDDPKRSTLEEMRRRILAIIPEAQQGISYSMPAFIVDGKPIVGLAAFKNHLSYLPHSGSVLNQLADELSGYEQTRGSLHFAINKPLPTKLIKALIAAKFRDIESRQAR